MEIINFFKQNSETITALTAIGALLISTLAIIRATQDNRKQIVVGKLEEIYELVIFLIVEYDKLYELEIELQNCGDETDGNYTEAKKKYNLEREKVKQRVNLDDLFDKVIRLHVLTNAYLSGELRLEVMAYSRLFECLMRTIRIGNLKEKKINYSEGFPTTANLRNVVGNLAKKLIIKINLGGDKESTYQDELYYRDNVYKRKLKLK